MQFSVYYNNSYVSYFVFKSHPNLIENLFVSKAFGYNKRQDCDVTTNILKPYVWRCESETRVPSSRGLVKQYD